jgi:hypothetical protein
MEPMLWILWALDAWLYITMLIHGIGAFASALVATQLDCLSFATTT